MLTVVHMSGGPRPLTRVRDVDILATASADNREPPVLLRKSTEDLNAPLSHERIHVTLDLGESLLVGPEERRVEMLEKTP